jgi:2-polyprenyl-6-methoxyphenol hydroxylase-like FAD-dependent oxidoreductase
MVEANRQSADVCIIGAGPVGLTMAMELAARGNSVILVEERTDSEISSPKSNHVSARSMEIYRRLGVADAIRAEGLPDDYPNDGVYATRFTGFELTRFRMPCRRDRFNDDGYDDGNLPSAERAARVSQMYLAPVLLDHVRKFPNVSILNGVKFQSLAQTDDAVTVRAVRQQDQAQLSIQCRYLIGADGARSDVRHALGIRLEGADNLMRARSRLFRAPGLLAQCGYPPAWMNWFYVDGKWSTMMAIDGKELWLMHNFVPPGMQLEDFDIDAEMRRSLGIDAGFSYETLRDEDWTGRRLVAERLRDGRCFIAGDAAHLWVPYGGYGMNAGIADAANLAWMLDAVLHGWAPDDLLDAHEAERKPVTERVSHFAAQFADTLKAGESAMLEQDTPEGAEVRARFGRRLYDANIQSMVPTGLNFGYAYDQSPIIAHSGETPPAFTMGSYTPTLIPGCRLPHFWLADGTPLYDALGPGFTLLRLDPDAGVQGLVDAAARRGVPLKILEIAPGKDFDPSVYTRKLVLARPDQHIAWRGDALPADGLGLIDLIRGASMARIQARKVAAS